MKIEGERVESAFSRNQLARGILVDGMMLSAVGCKPVQSKKTVVEMGDRAFNNGFTAVAIFDFFPGVVWRMLAGETRIRCLSSLGKPREKSTAI